MANRLLMSSLAACLGVVGTLAAQQPSAQLSAPRPLFGSRLNTNQYNYQESPRHSYQYAAPPAPTRQPGQNYPSYIAGTRSAPPAATMRPSHPTQAVNPGYQPTTGYYNPYRDQRTGVVPAVAAAQTAPQPVAMPVDALPHTAKASPAPALTYGPAPAPKTDLLSGYPTGNYSIGGCADASCAPAADCNLCDCLCGPPGRTWISGEWLFWTGSGNKLPPLATTAPVGTPRNVAGALGAPGTQIISGNQKVNDDFRNGFRLNAGMWLDECQRCGIEGNFFFLQDSRQGFGAGSDGSQIITRPFTNALTGVPDTQLVSFPGGRTGAPDTQLVSFPDVLAGSTFADSRSSVIGGGGNFIRNLCCNPCGRFDLILGGYQYMNLSDDLRITENLTALPGSNVPAGTQFLIQDRFQTDNDFHGVPIGAKWERRWSHWYIAANASVALGVMHSTTTISGYTSIIAPDGTSQNYPGGLLTQPTNIGRYTSNDFAVMPNVGVRLGVQVTDNLRAFVGYNYMYLSTVARSGDQIDLRVNPNQIAPGGPLNGPALPSYTGRKTDYSLQGISLGAELRF